MIVQVPVQRVAAVFIYLFSITGICLLEWKLSLALAEEVMIIALPHLDNGPLKPSLMEQRRLDAMFAVPPLPSEATTRVPALEAPSMPASILAARLDVAETEGSALPFTPYSPHFASPGEPSRLRLTHSRHADLSAGDIFNRSFGVLTVAAN
jgi:hypothetical protein